MDKELAMQVSETEPFENVCKEIHVSFDKKDFLVQVLCGLSQSQCRQIRKTYMKMYGKDLVQVFQEIGSGVHFLSNLLLNPFERDAIIAREAIHNNDFVNYNALIEIFTCRKSSHVLLILQAYHAKYRRQLDLDIYNIEPPHPFQKILVALSASHKAHNDDVSQHISKCDARRLYETGEGKPGAVDEAVVLEILSKRSIAQLRLMFFSYKHIYGHSYSSFLEKQDFGEFEDSVRVVVKCICNPAKHYAKILFWSLKGSKIDEGALLRVMVSRAEADMGEIQRVFKKKFGLELKKIISEIIPEGNYRDFLVVLATKAYNCEPQDWQ